MIGYKKGKYAVLLSTFMLIITVANCFAQTTVSAVATEKLEQFNSKFLQEKLYLHTDKDFYLAGEIIWFKIYYMDAVSYRPLDLSKLSYVEILDGNSKPVLQGKIPMEKGGGSGSFYLPLTIKSGNYTIRAYTNWMKNFGAGTFFEAPVSIVNTISAPAIDAKPDVTAVSADFFPEGGQLVQDITTKIGFRITGSNGKGLDAKGIITDDKGDTLTQFSPYRFGIGNFSLKPAAGRSYKAIFSLPDGRTITRSLPAAAERGYVMNVTDNLDGRFKISIHAKGTKDQDGDELFLVAHTQQAVKDTRQATVRNGVEQLFYIDKQKLSEGITYLTVFTRDRQPVCERLVFIQPAQSLTAGFSIPKESYGQREKIELGISFKTKNSNSADTANYSVSVYKVDSLEGFDAASIVSYRWLTSALQGQIESPGYYLSGEAGVAQAIDNLLLTHGWRRFGWDRVFNAGSLSSQKYIPEYSGHLVTGRVTSKQDGKPVAGALCFLSTPSVPFGFYTGKSDNNGFVQFDVKEYYGPGEIVIRPAADSISSYRADIITAFSEEPSQLKLPLFYAVKSMEEKLLQKSIAMQAQNLYRADNMRKFLPPTVLDTMHFFGRPEYSYRLDDYKRFTTMEEVLREYVFPVTVAFRNGKPHLMVQDELYRQVYDENTLVLMDGVPFSNQNKIFSYDPLKVKKMDVVTRRYLLGPANFAGIISIETFNGKFDAFTLEPGVITVDYEGLQLRREFYAPDYEKTAAANKRIPDLRTTLHWVPDMYTSTDATGQIRFFSSDQPGRYAVLLEGVTIKGETVTATGSFLVQ